MSPNTAGGSLILIRKIRRKPIGPQVVGNALRLHVLADIAQPAVKIEITFVSLALHVLEQKIIMEPLELDLGPENFRFRALPSVGPGPGIG